MDRRGHNVATEFGQNEWDELNRIIAGANYGWPFREGAGGSSEYEQPVQQWRTSQASPSGMAFVDGSFYIANLTSTATKYDD